jgi:hypothetical protein
MGIGIGTQMTPKPIQLGDALRPGVQAVLELMGTLDRTSRKKTAVD